jgi:hypothetical protein
MMREVHAKLMGRYLSMINNRTMVDRPNAATFPDGGVQVARRGSFCAGGPALTVARRHSSCAPRRGGLRPPVSAGRTPGWVGPIIKPAKPLRPTPVGPTLTEGRAGLRSDRRHSPAAPGTGHDMSECAG